MDDSGASDAVQSSSSPPSSRRWPVHHFAVGAYFALLGASRLAEVAPLVGGYVVDGYAAWLLPYLAALSAVLCLAGIAAFASGIGALRRASWAGKVGMIAAGLVGLCVVTHSGFLLLYENSFADGGLVYGILHLLTLTREATTGTNAGVAGYKIGLGIGVICWAIAAMVLLGASVPEAPNEESSRANDS